MCQPESPPNTYRRLWNGSWTPMEVTSRSVGSARRLRSRASAEPWSGRTVQIRGQGARSVGRMIRCWGEPASDPQVVHGRSSYVEGRPPPYRTRSRSQGKGERVSKPSKARRGPPAHRSLSALLRSTSPPGRPLDSKPQVTSWCGEPPPAERDAPKPSPPDHREFQSLIRPMAPMHVAAASCRAMCTRSVTAGTLGHRALKEVHVIPERRVVSGPNYVFARPSSGRSAPGGRNNSRSEEDAAHVGEHRCLKVAVRNPPGKNENSRTCSAVGSGSLAGWPTANLEARELRAHLAMEGLRNGRHGEMNGGEQHHTWRRAAADRIVTHLLGRKRMGEREAGWCRMRSGTTFGVNWAGIGGTMHANARSGEGGYLLEVRPFELELSR